MAVTITEVSGSEQNFHDRFCIGFPLQLEYDINFGEDISGRIVHINLWRWGAENDIEAPQPLPPHPLNTGFNIIHNGSNTYHEMPIGGNPSTTVTWENKTVEIRYPSSSTARIRIRMIHTSDVDSWVTSAFGLQNSKKLLYAKNDSPDTNYDTSSFYYPIYAKKYIGVRAQLWTLQENGQYKFDLGKDEAFLRRWAWWWNPANEVIDWPFSPVRFYYFELYRNNVPVLTFSTTEDTDVIFTIERNDGTLTFDDNYLIGLMKVDPQADNSEPFWFDIPYPLGRVAGVNTFSAAASWHHRDIGGTNIVSDCSLFALDSGDIWKGTFTVPKEVIEAGTVYKLVVIIQHTFTGLDP